MLRALAAAALSAAALVPSSSPGSAVQAGRVEHFAGGVMCLEPAGFPLYGGDPLTLADCGTASWWSWVPHGPGHALEFQGQGSWSLAIDPSTGCAVVGMWWWRTASWSFSGGRFRALWSPGSALAFDTSVGSPGAQAGLPGQPCLSTSGPGRLWRFIRPLEP